VFVVQPIMQAAAAALREHAEVEIFESERMISRDELKAGLRRSDFLYTLGTRRSR